MATLPQAKLDGIELSFVGDEVPDYSEFTSLILVAELGDEPVFALMLYWLRACSGRETDVNEFLSCLRGILDRIPRCEADTYIGWIVDLEQKWLAYVTFCAEKEKTNAAKHVTSGQTGGSGDFFFSKSKHYVTVVENVGAADGREGKDLLGRYGACIGKRIPVKPVSVKPDDLYARLSAKFPWADQAIHALVGDIATKLKFGNPKLSGCLRPFLLVGPAGCGKTTLLTEVAEMLQLPAALMPCGGSADSGGFVAVARGWASAKPCAPFEHIHANQIANPVIILDELEKSTPLEGARNGSIHGALLSMMNANGRYFDTCLQANVDLRYVNFWATANDLQGIPEPLLDRFNIIQVPAQNAKHADAIINGVIANEAKFLGVDATKLPKMRIGERKELACELTKKEGSIRAVQRAYRAWLAKQAMPTKVNEQEKKQDGAQVVSFDRYLH